MISREWQRILFGRRDWTRSNDLHPVKVMQEIDLQEKQA